MTVRKKFTTRSQNRKYSDKKGREAMYGRNLKKKPQLRGF